jgi:hypothetical protein
MGGYGSGRRNGGPTVEDALRLDIDKMKRWGVMQPGAHLFGEMTFNFDDDQLTLKFESRLDELQESWLRLQYTITDYWTGQAHQIDDKIFLVSTQPQFSGLRWWFLCPRLHRRVRKLYLPLGGRHFRSRQAYGLAYPSQRETAYDRAMRRVHKLYLRLGGDPADGEHPKKPNRMRWTTYSRLIDQLVAAERVVDDMVLGRWLSSKETGKSIKTVGHELKRRSERELRATPDQSFQKSRKRSGESSV